MTEGPLRRVPTALKADLEHVRTGRSTIEDWSDLYVLSELTKFDGPRPPSGEGVYLVVVDPDDPPEYLYVGQTKELRTRIGSLIADALGFYADDEFGHHSGGQSLHEWLNETDLWDVTGIVWASVECGPCAELVILRNLSPKLNKQKPSECPEHGPLTED